MITYLWIGLAFVMGMPCGALALLLVLNRYADCHDDTARALADDRSQLDRWDGLR